LTLRPLSRLARLGALTTQLGAQQLGERVADVFRDEEARKAARERMVTRGAQALASNLGALRGAAMKVGQAVAQAVEGMDVPPEARAALARLHDRADPVPFETIRAQVESELHGGIDTLFRRFDPEPLGTASLGQAHAAELPDGTRVVVKVLHAGVEDAVAADLAALKTVLMAGRALGRDREELDANLAEIRERLLEEVDYRKEAANLERFRRAFAGTDDITIPAPFPGWSTGRVLTMERLDGVPVAPFAASAPPRSRQRAGVALGMAFVKMQYVLRSIHADPHPGNYLFTPDGRIGLLDFGCVRTYDTQFMATYGQAGLHTIRGERDGVMECCMRMGALVRRDEAAEDALWGFCEAIARPFRGGAFTFGGPDDDVQDRLTAVIPRLLASRAIRSPRELVYLHRGLAGLHTVAKQLRPVHDWREVFESHVQICLRDAGRA
jgi:predicted unusual protein kinase regulating ubiquinone biosynthesis (AarF/ABC1/UbiB family)